jgi:hypothetical protein
MQEDNQEDSLKRELGLLDGTMFVALYDRIRNFYSSLDMVRQLVSRVADCHVGFNGINVTLLPCSLCMMFLKSRRTVRVY